MSDEAEIRGTLRKVGEATVEIYELSLDLDDSAREKLKADPQGTLRRLLESYGHKVNSLAVPDPQVVSWDHDPPPGFVHIRTGPFGSTWGPINIL